MALTDIFVTLAWLATFELPGGTLRYSDGGVVTWGADTFTATDDTFGTIGSVEPAEEGSGDQMPSETLTFLPASTAAAATLSSPTYQMSPLRFWLAEVDPATGEVVGTPDLVADRLLDTTTLRSGKSEEGGYRYLDVGMISTAERLFLTNEGNSLTSRFHKSVWPGEQGFDNATGVGLQVAWGVKSPPRGTVAIGGGGGGGFAEAVWRQIANA